jgi:hypothetical protein
VNRFSQSKAPTNVAEETGPYTCILHALLRGSLGFAGVSVAGFAVWAFAGKWLHAHVGDTGLYLACAIVFIAFSGLALHPLVRGSGSLVRFYKIFIPRLWRLRHRVECGLVGVAVWTG